MEVREELEALVDGSANVIQTETAHGHDRAADLFLGDGSSQEGNVMRCDDRYLERRLDACSQQEQANWNPPSLHQPN